MITVQFDKNAASEKTRCNCRRNLQGGGSRAVAQ